MRLLYVCCTRAMRGLARTFFVAAPTAAAAHIVARGVFPKTRSSRRTLLILLDSLNQLKLRLDVELQGAKRSDVLHFALVSVGALPRCPVTLQIHEWPSALMVIDLPPAGILINRMPRA